MTRPHPTGMDYPHGTYLAYQHRPCDCRPCTTAWSVYRQKLILRHRSGEVWADMDHYRTLLAPYADAGVAPTAIARACGVSPKSAHLLIGARDGRVRAATAAKVDGFGWDSLDDSAKVDAKMLRHELSRMTRRGATDSHLAATLGWSNWPTGYPHCAKAQLGVVRRARMAADMYPHIPSETCDTGGCDGPTPLWLRWCQRCVSARATPSRSELDGAVRRRRDRDRQRAYRKDAA